MKFLNGRNQVLLVTALNVVVHKVSQIAHLIHNFAQLDVVFVLVLIHTTNYQRIKSDLRFAQHHKAADFYLTEVFFRFDRFRDRYLSDLLSKLNNFG